MTYRLWHPYLNAVALVTIGFVLGGLLSIIAPIIVDAGMERYDQMNPVINAESKVVSYSGDEIVISFVGEKRRACLYVGINAYASEPIDGVPSRMYIQRVDTPETGETRPLGKFSMGTWRIWPLEDAREVTVYVQHVCTGRLVATTIARIKLGPTKRSLPRLTG